jgi:hypothetical protein
VEEERGHGAGPCPSEIASGREVAIDECGRRAIRVSHSISITKLAVRSLVHACGNWNDEISMEVALYARGDSASVTRWSW